MFRHTLTSTLVVHLEAAATILGICPYIYIFTYVVFLVEVDCKNMNWFFSSFFAWLWPPNPWSPYPESKVRIHYKEKTTTETKLEQSGDLNTLQRFRYRVHTDTKYTNRIPIKQFLDTEQDLRHYTQEELFAREHDDGSEQIKTRLNYVTRQSGNSLENGGTIEVNSEKGLYRGHSTCGGHILHGICMRY